MKRLLLALTALLTACGIGGQTMPELTPRSLWRIEVFDQLGNSRGTLSDTAAIKNITASLKPDYTCDTMSFEANADKLNPTIRPLDLVQLSTNDSSFIATNGGTQFAPVFYGEVITPGTPFSFSSSRFTVRNMKARLGKISPVVGVLFYPGGTVQDVAQDVANDLPTHPGLYDSGTLKSAVTYSSSFVYGSSSVIGDLTVNARSYAAIFDELTRLTPTYLWGVRPDKRLQMAPLTNAVLNLNETNLMNPARIAWKSPDASSAVNTVHWLLEIKGVSGFFRHTSSVRGATEGEQSISLSVPEGLNLLIRLPSTYAATFSAGGSYTSFSNVASGLAVNDSFLSDGVPGTGAIITGPAAAGSPFASQARLTITATSGTAKFLQENFTLEAAGVFKDDYQRITAVGANIEFRDVSSTTFPLADAKLTVREFIMYGYDTATLDTLAQGYYRPATADAASVTVDGILEPTKTVNLTLGSGLILTRPAALYTYNWDAQGYATTTVELGDAYSAADATLVNLIAARDSAAQLNAQIFAGKVR